MSATATILAGLLACHGTGEVLAIDPRGSAVRKLVHTGGEGFPQVCTTLCTTRTRLRSHGWARPRRGGSAPGLRATGVFEAWRAASNYRRDIFPRLWMRRWTEKFSTVTPSSGTSANFRGIPGHPAESAPNGARTTHRSARSLHRVCTPLSTGGDGGTPPGNVGGQKKLQRPGRIRGMPGQERDPSC